MVILLRVMCCLVTDVAYNDQGQTHGFCCLVVANKMTLARVLCDGGLVKGVTG